MSTNPNFEICKKIEDQVLAEFGAINPARHFAPIPIGAGKEYFQRKFALMPKIPSAVKEAVFSEIDKFQSQDGHYRCPQHRLDILIENNEYEQMMAGGEYAGFAKSAALSMAKAMAKTLFQASPMGLNSANMFPYYGLIDAGTGSGTFDRPITAGVTTKAGVWTTATYCALDIGGLVGDMRKHYAFNDGTPLVLFYPSIAEKRWVGIVPDITGAVVFCRELAQRAELGIGVMEAVDNDESAYSLLTGNTEAVADFEMVLCNPNWFAWIYDKAPIARMWTNDAGDKHYLQLEEHGGLMPIPVYEADAKYYKAMTYVDACCS